MLGTDPAAFTALKKSLSDYIVKTVTTSVIKSGNAGFVIEGILVKFASGGFGTQPAVALWNKTIASNVI